MVAFSLLLQVPLPHPVAGQSIGQLVLVSPVSQLRLPQYLVVVAGQSLGHVLLVSPLSHLPLPHRLTHWLLVQFMPLPQTPQLPLPHALTLPHWAPWVSQQAERLQSWEQVLGFSLLWQMLSPQNPPVLGQSPGQLALVSPLSQVPLPHLPVVAQVLWAHWSMLIALLLPLFCTQVSAHELTSPVHALTQLNTAMQPLSLWQEAHWSGQASWAQASNAPMPPVSPVLMSVWMMSVWKMSVPPLPSPTEMTSLPPVPSLLPVPSPLTVPSPLPVPSPLTVPSPVTVPSLLLTPSPPTTSVVVTGFALHSVLRAGWPMVMTVS